MENGAFALLEHLSSEANEARTHGRLVSSQALYH